jgi:hypothetical protein
LGRVPFGLERLAVYVRVAITGLVAGCRGSRWLHWFRTLLVWFIALFAGSGLVVV